MIKFVESYKRIENESCPDLEVFHKFELLLGRYFKTKKRLEFYSEALGISLRHLNAICLHNLGKTLYELIQERRFKESKRLLKSSTLSVKEITYYLGFSDPPYFIRYFKKQTGQTPRRYRIKGKEMSTNLILINNSHSGKF